MPSPTRLLLLLLLATTVLTFPGCGGCRQETPAERAARLAREEEERLKKLEEKKKEQEEKKKKPPIEAKLPLPQPNQPDRPIPMVKPGHWMGATQVTKANYEDWVGRAQQQIVDRKDQPVALNRTAFTLRTSRNAALAKGQEKALETILFAPNTTASRRLRTSLLDRGGGYADPPSSVSLKQMLLHQYHFVILAAEPERYGFLRNGNYAIDAPASQFIEVKDPSVPDAYIGPAEYQRNYFVVAPPLDKRLPLADNALCWTTTAYVLWDEVDPERLDTAQRDAMIDWLHWGGQLIISGPDSLDLLAESFLSPYLPADPDGPQELAAADLKGLEEAFQVARQPVALLNDDSSWSGVKLKLRPEAEPLAGLGGLFAERRVGRGRVIVSSMQLAERGLINWSSGFENLFNALILRRPPRRFAWENVNEGGLYVRDVSRNSPQLSAAANTQLRYFARDSHKAANALQFRVANQGDRDQLVQGGGFNNWDLQNQDSQMLVPGGEAGGAGSWSDANATAYAARESLLEAAGVKVPGRGFVISCLAVYLAVIGPINWFFFKALGRVELAWVAAPVITAVATVAVVRVAELDIGFARAQTEIAILETQPGHDRGHLSRYTAVYTSLATTYEFASEEPTTLIAPFPRSNDPNFKLLRGQALTEVTFERQEQVRLKGFTVSSASADMTHAEQMVGLPAGLIYDAQQRKLINRSGHDLHSLAVVRREAPRVVRRRNQAKAPPLTLMGCWIGDLPADEGVTVQFSPIPFSEDAPVFAAERATDTEQAREERLNLEPLFRLALDPARIEPGEVRAVARVDDVLPGIEVTPAAAQVNGATLVVAHLEYAPLPTPVSDANAPMDVRPRR